MTKLKVSVISALVIAGAATPIILSQQANARLRSQNEALQQQAAEVEQLREENQRLAKLNTNADELARLRTEHEELLRLRGQVSATQQRQPAKAGSGGSTQRGSKSPSSPESPSIPLLSAADWKDVGTANPSDTLQTLFWARANQDTNAFIKTLSWDPAAKAKLDTLFAAAPESVRLKFGSADGLIWEMAMGGHDTPMTGFGVVSIAIHGDDAKLIEEHQYQDGGVRQNPITLHREEDGWHVLLDEQRLEKLMGYLSSLTSQKGNK